LVDHLEEFFFLEFAFGNIRLLLLLFVLEDCLEMGYFVGFGLDIVGFGLDMVLEVYEGEVGFLELLLFVLKLLVEGS
jgi:hypothetical protein